MLLSSAIHTRLIKSYGVINTFRLLLPDQQHALDKKQRGAGQGCGDILGRGIYVFEAHTLYEHVCNQSDWLRYVHSWRDGYGSLELSTSQPSSSLTSLYGDEKVMMMMTTTKSIIAIRTGHQVYINWMVSPAQSCLVYIYVTTKASQPAHKAGGGKEACQSHKTRLKFSK